MPGQKPGIIVSYLISDYRWYVDGMKSTIYRYGAIVKIKSYKFKSI